MELDDEAALGANMEVEEEVEEEVDADAAVDVGSMSSGFALADVLAVTSATLGPEPVGESVSVKAETVGAALRAYPAPRLELAIPVAVAVAGVNADASGGTYSSSSSARGGGEGLEEGSA